MLARRLPSQINVGAFQITTKKMRAQLLQKKEQLVALVTELICKVPRATCQDLERRFLEIEKQLKAKTTNPEEVAAQREYIASLPQKLGELQAEINGSQVGSGWTSTAQRAHAFILLSRW